MRAKYQTFLWHVRINLWYAKEYFKFQNLISRMTGPILCYLCVRVVYRSVIWLFMHLTGLAMARQITRIHNKDLQNPDFEIYGNGKNLWGDFMEKKICAIYFQDISCDLTKWPAKKLTIYVRIYHKISRQLCRRDKERIPAGLHITNELSNYQRQ